MQNAFFPNIFAEEVTAASNAIDSFGRDFKHDGMPQTESLQMFNISHKNYSAILSS